MYSKLRPPSGVRRILTPGPRDAFFYCTSLQYNVYDNANYLGNANNPYVALIKATNTAITSCEIHSDTKFICSSAFSGRTSLTSVTIPDSVTSIGNSVFCDCTSLTSITVADGNPVYHSAGNCLIETASKTLIAGCNNSVIPTDGSVTSIGRYAFSYCTSLTSVTIPDSVTSIGDWAFDGCTSLTSVTIPDSVTSIGGLVFCDCTSLTSVTIPDGVTSIGISAFDCCTSLTSIDYQGTKAQWNAISKGSDWNYNTGSYTIHCTDGDIAKS